MSELKIDTRLWSSKARNLSPYVLVSSLSMKIYAN